jgi:hypothetical protein
LLYDVILFLIAKKLYNYIFQLFQNEELKLKDRFKPTYYALMHYMKKEFPDEMLKMGSELEEPVNAVIKEIELMAKKYV